MRSTITSTWICESGATPCGWVWEGPRHDLLAGLIVAVQVDRRVLLLQPAQGGVDLVLVALVLGLHRERHHRRRQLDAGHVDRLVARRQPVAGVGLLELGHGADVARPELVGMADLLAA